MMFIDSQTLEIQQKYEQCLKIIGSLSRNFCESDIVYISHRIAKQIFKNSFGLKSLNDDNLVIDVKKESLGIALKTFHCANNKTFQTIDKFSPHKYPYQDLCPLDLIIKISKLRNEKINFTKNTHGVKKIIYHCILRDIGKFKIFEESLDRIDIENINLIKNNNNSILFEDAQHQYSFLLSKGILKKRFVTELTLIEIDIEILTYPFEYLTDLLSQN